MALEAKPQIEKWSSGTEVAIYPKVGKKSALFGNHYISWVAYSNQDPNFKDRYGKHIELTGQLLLNEISIEERERIGVNLDAIGFYEIKGQPKLYMSKDGVGSAIGHIGAAMWSYKKGMDEKSIRNATYEIFGTWPGRQVGQDAVTMGLVVPPARGDGWEFPPNAQLVLEKNFVGTDGLVYPTHELLLKADEDAAASVQQTSII